jgi:hypothetical protein
MSEQTTVLKVESWLKQHERLLIVAILVVASYFAINKGLGIVASYEGHRAQEAAAVTAAQAAKNAESLTQAQQMLQAYQQQLAATVAANQKLTTAIVARDAQLSIQQKTDTTLAPSDLASRWATLVNDKGIGPASGGYAVTESAAVATVIQLESVPVLTQDLNDEKIKESNLQADVTKANGLIDQGKTVVSGLQLQLTDQSKECTLSLNAEKAKGRVGKLKAFGYGYVTGLVSGFVLKFF